MSYIDGGRNLHTLVVMVTRNENGLVRVTVTLEPVDVDLLDRLAALEGQNRSSELRSILTQLRPTLVQTVNAFESALTHRDALDQAAAEASVSELQELLPEAEKLQNLLLGILAKFEGNAAAKAAFAEELAALDPRSSNHGGHNLTPPPEDTTK